MALTLIFGRYGSLAVRVRLVCGLFVSGAPLPCGGGLVVLVHEHVLAVII